MAKKKVVEEVEETLPEPKVHGRPNCPACGGDGLKLVGWDEDGNDVNETCSECEGTGK